MVTSFQSLHCTLTSSVRGPDLLSKLFDDGQQLCIFVLRHLAARRALRFEQTVTRQARFSIFYISICYVEGTLTPDDNTIRTQAQ